jgi:hypothetical protein
MIDTWKAACRRCRCNFLAEEMPELVRVNAQAAINWKPEFILRALSACRGRTVVYLDGDMLVRQYPRIFDMPNVDFFARGWHVDGRDEPGAPCFDPYMLETSGGVLAFSQSDTAHSLLAAWSQALQRNVGRADDRVLSQLILTGAWMATANIVQLPLEFLFVPEEHQQLHLPRRSLVFEHPCQLTEETTARKSGGVRSRIPPKYRQQLTRRVKCFASTVCYTFLACPSLSVSRQFEPSLRHFGPEVVRVVDFKDRLGTFNAVSAENISRAQRPCLPDSIPGVLSRLQEGRDVWLGGHSEQIPGEAELVCTNMNRSKARHRAEYTLEVDWRQPVFFRRQSRVLFVLISMCRRWSDFSAIFNSSPCFLSLIRCHWKE